MREAAATAGNVRDRGDLLLDIRDLDAYYGDLQAIFSVSLTVGAGEVLAIIGANGAGKSTLLNAIAGLVGHRGGSIRYLGADIGDLGAASVVARGIALVPEGRRLFASLTVEENLVIGGRLRRPGPWCLRRIYELFPVLEERRAMPATALSGGQQQMVAIGRALMSNPRLLLCDEISLGLAPIVVRDIYQCLPRLTGEGTALIVVEQDIAQALRAADHVLCLQEGRVALQGAPMSLTREAISAAYFGI